MLLIDATFAPGSQVLKKISTLAPNLPAMVFLSMSKSISRGMTTAGTIIANHTTEMITLRNTIYNIAYSLDTIAKPDQMERLIKNHIGVEIRCQKAYDQAFNLGQTLINAVKKATNKDMILNFVAPEHAAVGFTSSK